MTEPLTQRLWVDPDGAVWLEDPTAGLTPVAQALAPGFTWPTAASLELGARLRTTRAWPVPHPWPHALEDLWALHDVAMNALRAGSPPPAAPAGCATLLALKRDLAERLLRGCVLCEHRCNVDRPAGARGRCGVGAVSRFALPFVHLGEELEVAPSLCVPLTGCSWHCVYCHTADLINRVDAGTPLVPAEHGALLEAASAPDVRSLSFVGGNPDHHLPAILRLLEAAPAGFDRAIVWNSNMYGSPELYRLLEGVVDVYLGDWRYGNDACAARLSGIAPCWQPVARNWAQVAGQDALSIVRVLVLPGHLPCCTLPILRHVARHHPSVMVSVLDQYHPAYRAGRVAPELARTPTSEEVATVSAEAKALGLRLVAPH
ncbi:MAG: radical SAM protein [Candidatus Sericytochromatia bacterium]|nr:radical SAM protein [Candidatus Sericytochromatia bacterium]